MSEPGDVRLAGLGDEQPVQLRRGYRLQWEPRQESWVMLFPEGMVRLNESAGMVLELCAEPVCIAALVEALRARFPDDDIEEDIREFVQEAYEQNWLQRC